MRRSERRRAADGLLAAAALTAAGCFTQQYKTRPRVAQVSGDPVVQMTSPEKLPSLNMPAMVTFGKHTCPPDGDSLVVGLEGRAPRAYPLGLLAIYEVVNDESEELPFVVTRCPLTEIVAVYDRRVAGRTLTFINSGALWRDTLVIQDKETGTLWTSATGRALSGPLSGEQLRALPARFTTTAAWRLAFPSSLYLDTGEIAVAPLKIRLYGLSPWQGVSGVKTSDNRYKPKEAVFAVVLGGEALGFSGSELARLGSTEISLGGRSVRLTWDQRTAAPRAYAPEEIAVTSMYWFALDRHFDVVRTLTRR